MVQTTEVWDRSRQCGTDCRSVVQATAVWSTKHRQRSQLFVVARAILATAGLVGQGQLRKVATYGRATVLFLIKSSLWMRQATAELPDW